MTYDMVLFPKSAKKLIDIICNVASNVSLKIHFIQ